MTANTKMTLPPSPMHWLRFRRHELSVEIWQGNALLYANCVPAEPAAEDTPASIETLGADTPEADPGEAAAEETGGPI